MDIYFLSTLDHIGYMAVRLLLSLFWQSILLFFIIGCIVYGLRGKGPAIRYILWVSAMLLLPFLPVFSWLLSNAGAPSKEIPVLPRYVKIRQEFEFTGSSRSQNQESAHEISGLQPGERTDSSVSASDGNKTHSIPAILDYPWALMFTVYLTCVSFYFLRILSARIRVRQWVTRSEAVIDDHILSVFGMIGKDLGITRPLTIAETEYISVPFTVHIVNPVVVLPKNFITGLSDNEIRAIAIHELTHVKRCDSLVITVMSLLKALFFFNPAVWYVVREISYLTETIADSAVLDNGIQPQPYARLIAKVAERLPLRRISTEYAAGIVFSKTIFLRRINTILSRHKYGKLTGMSLAAVVLLLMIAIPVLFLFPPGDMNKTDYGKVIVTGRVVHEGKPVPGINIFAHMHNSADLFAKYRTDRVTKTNRDGFFKTAIDTLIYPRSEISIIAYSPQYALGSIPLHYFINHVDSIIQLERPVQLSGVVRNTSGMPVAGATVTVLEMETGLCQTLEFPLMIPFKTFLWNRDYTLPGMTVHTGSDGTFTFNSLPERTQVRLSITAPGYAESNSYLVFSGLTDIPLLLRPEGRIEGKVLFGDSGKPARNIPVMFYSKNPPETIRGGYGASVTDRNGIYTFSNLSSGPYLVTLKTDESFSDWTAAPLSIIQVREGETTHVPDLILIKGCIVSGRMVNTDTELPVPGVRIQAELVKDDNPILLDYCTTDEKGEYRFRVVPGKIRISGYGIITVEENRFSSKEVEKIVTLADGEKKTGIDLPYTRLTSGDVGRNVSKTDNVKIYVKILDSEGIPVSGALVYAFDGADKRFIPSYMQLSLSNNKGVATFNSIKEGTMLVLQAEHSNRRMKGKSEIIVAKQGLDAVVKLKPYITISVSGQVVDESDNPVAGAFITVNLLAGRGIATLYKMFVNDRGYFTIPDLILNEDYSIESGAEGYEGSKIILSPLTEDRLPLPSIILKKYAQ